MTHDEFLIALRDAPSWAGSGPDRHPTLDAEAAAHARDCADCGRLLEALSCAARDDASLPDAVPPDYWSTFGSRVLARLPRAESMARLSPTEPLAGRQRHGLAGSGLWLRIAAGLVVGALALIAWRTARPMLGSDVATDDGTKIAPASEFLATMAPEDVEDALVGFSVSGFDMRAPEDLFATDAAPADPIAADGAPSSQFPDDAGDAGGPVERLESELLENLSESDQRELVRRLQEASS